MSGENERSSRRSPTRGQLHIIFGWALVSLGCDWTRLNCNFGKPIDITNPQPLSASNVYFDGASSGTIDAVAFTLTAGYAFSN